jgi:hypothetical protein
VSADNRERTVPNARAWSYGEITDATEIAVRECLQCAADSRRRGDDAAAMIHENFAFGILMGWAAITGGSTVSGDQKRLEALCEKAVEGHERAFAHRPRH